MRRDESLTYMREMLDKVDPRSIRGIFTEILRVARQGKVLELFRFIDNDYLVAIDGTDIFESKKVHCNNCCEKKHRDGSISYHHQILGGVLIHPDSRQVIPFCPEPIIKQDGKTKNDCELNAAYRFVKDFKHEHPQLKVTFTCDALYANAPFIHMLKKQNFGYIIVAKEGANKTLFEWIKGIELKEYEIVVGSTTYSFRFINNIPLNDTKDAPSVNFFQCKEIKLIGKEKKEKQERNFSWVTSHHITEKNIFKLMRGGRTKWKVENETFNTLKNQGYHFEHNFGHGKKNLHTVFAFLMMSAFLIDQIAEIADGLFQMARQELISRRSLWEKMRGFFYTVLMNSWEDLFNRLTFGDNNPVAIHNTS